MLQLSMLLGKNYLKRYNDVIGATMKKIPYGLSDLKLIKSENYYYIDKTPFVLTLEEQSSNFLMFLVLSSLEIMAIIRKMYLTLIFLMGLKDLSKCFV